MKTRTGVVGIVLLVVMMIAGAAVAAGHLAPSTTDTQNVY